MSTMNFTNNMSKCFMQLASHLALAVCSSCFACCLFHLIPFVCTFSPAAHCSIHVHVRLSAIRRQSKHRRNGVACRVCQSDEPLEHVIGFSDIRLTKRGLNTCMCSEDARILYHKVRSIPLLY